MVSRSIQTVIIHTYSATGNLLTKGGQTLTYPASTPGGCTSGCTGGPCGRPFPCSYSHSYDCAGNVTTRIVGGSSTYTFTYNEENQLTAVSGAATGSFVYDGDGRRVKATVGATTTVYIGDHYGHRHGAVPDRRPPFDWLGVAEPLRAGLGSTSLTLNNTGGLVAEIRYKAWGESRYTSGTTPTARHYTGQIEESGLGGLYFYNARWYEPGVGRFLQADTVVPGAGNPQALNRYSYVLNGPLTRNDPSGHEPCETGSGVACSGGTRNAKDDGYRHNSNAWQRQLDRWMWEQRGKARAAYSDAAWKADKWLYENVPSAVGLQTQGTFQASAGLGQANVTATTTYLFNWRSGQADKYTTIEGGPSVGLSSPGPGGSGGIGAVAVVGASSNDNWEGQYIDWTVSVGAGPGLYYGESAGLRNDWFGGSLVPAITEQLVIDPLFVDPASGMHVTTSYIGLGATTPGATWGVNYGTTTGVLRERFFDVNVPFQLVPPNNPYIP